jgi:hypothetical protein
MLLQIGILIAEVDLSCSRSNISKRIQNVGDGVDGEVGGLIISSVDVPVNMSVPRSFSPISFTPDFVSTYQLGKYMTDLLPEVAALVVVTFVALLASGKTVGIVELVPFPGLP